MTNPILGLFFFKFCSKNYHFSFSFISFFKKKIIQNNIISLKSTGNPGSIYKLADWLTLTYNPILGPGHDPNVLENMVMWTYPCCNDICVRTKWGSDCHDLSMGLVRRAGKVVIFVGAGQDRWWKTKQPNVDKNGPQKLPIFQAWVKLAWWLHWTW